MRQLDSDDVDDVLARNEAAFGPAEDPDAAAEGIRAGLELGQWWGWEVDGRLAAQTRLLDVDHWFGGRRVPCLDIASVAVAPADRGRGVAWALMVAALHRGVEHRKGLSLLFPATTRLYRRLGWEHAGTFTRWRLDARLTPAVGPAMRAATAADWPAIRQAHLRFGALHNGPAVRAERTWERLRGSRWHHVLDGDDGLDAYLLVDQVRKPHDWRHTLAVRDWAALTPRGLAGVVGHVGRHGTIAADATMRGPLPGILSLLTDEEQDAAYDSGFAWMARGVHLPTAVSARGFPAGLSGSATFTVDDPLLPSARGPWRLTVADGAGELVLTDTDRADARLDARAVGPLLTGFYAPAQLRLAGLCDGDDVSLAWLTTAFAGTPPLQLDFF